MLKFTFEYVMKSDSKTFRTVILSQCLENALNQFFDIENNDVRLIRIYINDYEITKALEDITLCL